MRSPTPAHAAPTADVLSTDPPPPHALQHLPNARNQTADVIRLSTSPHPPLTPSNTSHAAPPHYPLPYPPNPPLTP